MNANRQLGPTTKPDLGASSASNAPRKCLETKAWFECDEADFGFPAGPMTRTPSPAEESPNVAPARARGKRTVSRRRLLQATSALGIGSVAFGRALAAQVAERAELTAEMIAQAEWVAGIELDEDKREEVARSVRRILRSGEQLREQEVDADTSPALVFRPDFYYAVAQNNASDPSTHAAGADVKVAWSKRLPETAASKLTDEDLAFLPITEQASLLAEGKLTSRRLTELYLGRLKKYDPVLHCVVTLLEDHALELADASDKRRKEGKSLGVLDGIPWVAKDLIAVPPWKTTWGAEPFKDQVRNEMATVAERLSAAGAVLLAKVTLGAMAWGDVWFGGVTRNPWNPKEGSSGSSAGSASAVAAGLASFALGSETLGSIVSPCTRCRTSGLRPTFGRVSRAGCMPLSWSMDKIGPIARHINDLALIFPVLLGIDGRDPTLVERSYQWPIQKKLSDMKIGIAGGRLSGTEKEALELLRAQGAEIVDIDLDSEIPVGAMNFILGTEASTVFDDSYRAEPDADYGNWPSTFRSSQFVPAIQYIRANRMRGDLITETEKKLATVDVVLGGNDLLLTNLTGHPSIVVACGADESDEIKLPGVIKLTAAAYQEEKLLHVGAAIQQLLRPTPARPTLEIPVEEESDDE